MQIILGIDPGSKVTGWGVIAFANGEATHINSGIINLSKIKKSIGSLNSTAIKLDRIYTSIVEIVKSYKVSHAAIEQVFLAKNVNAALVLGQVRGAALAALGSCQLPVNTYAPTAVKLAVAGYGRASKLQVAKMTSVSLNIQHSLPEDTTDALAVALCDTTANASNKLNAAIARAQSTT